MEESNDIGETTMVNKNGMKKLYSLKQLEDSNILLNKKPPVFIKKLLMILVGVLVILVLFITFFKVDISVDANASVEPSNDIITLKATSKAEIEEVYKKDGDTVEEGEKILKLKNIEKEVNSKLLNETKENLEKKKQQLQRLHDSISSEVNKLNSDDPVSYVDEYNNYIQSINTLQTENNVQANSALRGKSDTSAVDNLEVEKEVLVEKINRIIEIYNNEQESQMKLRLKEQISQGQSDLSKLQKTIDVAYKNINKRNSEINAAARDIATQGNAKVENLKTTTLSSISSKLTEVDDALKAKTSEVNGNKELMNDLEIKAVHKGKIRLEKNLTKGNGVELSQPLVSILQEESKNKVILYIQPKDIKSMKKDKQITIQFDNEDKSIVKGRVLEISELPTTFTTQVKDSNKEQNITVYEVKVDVQSGDEKLAYGMVGAANVKVGKESMWNYVKRHLFGGSKISI